MSDQTYAQTDRVAVTEVDSELVLLDLEDGTFFVSKGIGPRVWELLVEGAAVTAIADEIAQRYSIDLTKALDDVNEFVTRLVERGFIEATS